MKNIFLLALLVIGTGLFVSCQKEAPKAKTAKNEMATKKKKATTNKKKAVNNKKANAQAGYWKTAEHRFELTEAQVKKLKQYKADFIAAKKKLGKSPAKKATDAIRTTYYTNIKAALGAEKGQQYINYSRRYKRKKADAK